MYAKARAQAEDSLEEAIRVLKRQQSATRTAIQLLRQSQAGFKGVEVEIITEVEGGQSVRSEDGSE